MRIASYQFKPNIIATILVLIGVLFLINLGTWQLSRADEKQLIINDVDQRKSCAALNLAELDNLDDKNYYQVQFEGHFDYKHYLLLDNRIHKSMAGFEVIQPFITQGRVVLVNRGWIPLPRERKDLPKIPEELDFLMIQGEVNVPGRAIVLKEDQLSSEKPWPQLVQSINMKQLSALYGEINMTIEPWVLRQKADDNPFYRRLWFTINMTPDRHISYAVTWFGLALALIIIYIAAVTSREENKFGNNATQKK